MIKQLGKMGGSLLGLGATAGAGAGLGALFAPNDRIEGALKGAAVGGMLYGGSLINKNVSKLMASSPNMTKKEALSRTIGHSVGRQAMGGAISGAVVGGLNPMGDDGFFRGAAKGAMYGGALGAVIGSKPVYRKLPRGSMLNANKHGLHSGFNGRLALMKDGKKFSNFTNPTYGGVAGVAGGVFGGSGRKRQRQNTTMQANQWTMGTHPRYFGNY